jgi:adenosylhomocysteine nucleosidase
MERLGGRLGESRVRTGTVLSGNAFVADPAHKRALAGAYGSVLAIEMEAAGVAQTASKLGIPFVVAKTIADRLNPPGSIADEYRQFLKRAADNAAGIVERIHEDEMI